MEGLRIELPGEFDDGFLGEGVAAGIAALADNDIFVILHNCSSVLRLRPARIHAFGLHRQHDFALLVAQFVA